MSGCNAGNAVPNNNIPQQPMFQGNQWGRCHRGNESQWKGGFRAQRCNQPGNSFGPGCYGFGGKWEFCGRRAQAWGRQFVRKLSCMRGFRFRPCL